MSPGVSRRAGWRYNGATVRHLLFFVYIAACLGALTWPGYDWLGNRIEPYILGVPFSFAWVIGWILLTFLALVAYHTSGTHEPEEPSGSELPKGRD